MDLHIHSTCSDGELTPSEIVCTAYGNGLSVVSITDHDEIAGYYAGKGIADYLGITLVPGIELNTDGEDGELHILGYDFDPDSTQLIDHVNWRKKERIEWSVKIVKKLQQLGYHIDFTHCLDRARGAVMVRTHIADELVGKGYFSTSDQAYDALLKKGAPAFVNRAEFTAQDAIKLIHKAGGEAYLAHPGTYPFEIPMDRLIAYGLDGVEAYHSKHTELQTSFWEKFAVQAGFKLSGGSDSHGPDSRNPYPIGSVKFGESCIRQWNRQEVIR